MSVTKETRLDEHSCEWQGRRHGSAECTGIPAGGVIVTILLGIGGALVGGFLGRMLGWDGEADPVGFLMAVMGAILVVFVFRKPSGPPRVGVKGGS